MGACVPPALTVVSVTFPPLSLRGVLGIATTSEGGKGGHCRQLPPVLRTAGRIPWACVLRTRAERGSCGEVPALGSTEPWDLPVLLPKK